MLEVLKPGQLRCQRTPARGACVGRRNYVLPEETFFPAYRATAPSTHNTNNSSISGQVRNLLGFTGFLVVQTFHSQVNITIHKEKK